MRRKGLEGGRLEAPDAAEAPTALTAPTAPMATMEPIALPTLGPGLEKGLW